MPVDPVCGIEMDEKLATTYKHRGKDYYFCSEGCKRIFSRKPGKYTWPAENIVSFSYESNYFQCVMTVVVISPEIKIYQVFASCVHFWLFVLALKITDAWLFHLASTVSAKSESCFLANRECTYLVARTFSAHAMRY